ncbi:hypothetical protein ACLOJK_029391 [Asimina triloba]
MRSGALMCLQDPFRIGRQDPEGHSVERVDRAQAIRSPDQRRVLVGAIRSPEGHAGNDTRGVRSAEGWVRRPDVRSLHPGSKLSGSPTGMTPTGRLPPLPRASMLLNGVVERTSRSLNDDSSGDGSGENLVVKRARVGVVPGWVTEQEVLSATPLRSIEARGNGGRRPMGVGPVGLPLCRNKVVRVGWVDVGGAEAWASYQSTGTQSEQYLSSDPGWWDLTPEHYQDPIRMGIRSPDVRHATDVQSGALIMGIRSPDLAIRNPDLRHNGDLSMGKVEERVGIEDSSSWAREVGLELGRKRGDLDLETSVV